MPKGRNAAKTFTATRAARFADAREETAKRRTAEVEAGTRREGLLVRADDVRESDEVTLAAGGFAVAAETPRAAWAVTEDGMTFVRRFRA